MKSLSSLAFIGLASVALASPTGLNVIPTTDIVPLNNWILGIQNGNTSFTNPSLFQQPTFFAQSQISFESWLEAGLDYAETPDLTANTMVFNVKALVLNETEHEPNIAVGFWNVAIDQKPGYYITASKTLNYDQEQDERFKAHHRRSRKLLGRRIHLGMMLDGHGIAQPFAGTDLQLSETTVFQADYVNGSGNALTAGLSYTFPDQRTVFVPALVFSNDTKRISGLILNFSHQFNL